jgi:predicted O-methyltransferase YrrM
VAFCCRDAKVTIKKVGCPSTAASLTRRSALRYFARTAARRRRPLCRELRACSDMREGSKDVAVVAASYLVEKERNQLSARPMPRMQEDAMISTPDFNILASLPSHKELAAAFDAAAATNEAARRINEVYRTNVMFRIPGRTTRLNPSCTYPDEGRILWYLVNKLRPSTVVEVGFGFGSSAAFMLAGLAPHDGKLISIDASRTWTGGNGEIYIDHLKLARYHTLIEGRSDIVLPDFIARKKIPAPLKLSFIDGSHLFEDALMDFVFLDRMAEIGGIIALDDASAPALRTVASYIAHNYPYKLHYATSRLLLCQKLDTLDKRQWCHFKPFQCSTRTDWDVHTTPPDPATVPGATFGEAC